MINDSKKKIFITFFVFVFLYLLIIAKLFYWQIIASSELKELGINQSSSSITIQAKRGEILSSDNYPLATSTTTFLMYSNPKVLEKDKVYEYSSELSGIVKLDRSLIYTMLTKDLYWVKIADSIDHKRKREIEKLNIPGIGFAENEERFYPESSMSAHLLGFVGRDEKGEKRGYFGIEGYYEEQLAGRSGKLFMMHDAVGNPIINDIREEKRINGRSLILNIDRTVQFVAEKKLKEGVERYQAQGGSVVIMDPKTGKILAMTSYPHFDPKNYYKFDYESYRNPAVSTLYEPGSTFKVLVMAAAIDAGVVDPDTRCNICSGPIEISEYKIKTWNDTYYTNPSMTEVIQHSDNTGMVFAVRKLGLENFIEYLERYGLGERTGIDLEGEITTTIKKKKGWYPIDLATASFGQGISMTPLQLLTAVSAIANGGVMVKPYLVSEIITDDGNSIVIKPEEKRKIISNQTASKVTEMMVNAVEKGESNWVKIDGYKIAGKTGTAQIPIQGKYDPEETIASFIGFFPAEDPQVSMLVLINRPKTSIYGSETAAPVFFSIAREIIHYYGISPSFKM
jgi:stage V sporulation protein D (sporulation-specific penicillin-binding protein)